MALIQGAGGFFSIIVIYTAWLTYQVNNEKQVAERFSKAVEQLGNENIHVRLGGIYALEQISKDAGEKYHWQVMETLCSFVRERSPNRPAKPKKQMLSAYLEDSNPDEKVPPLPTDIQAVMTVISRRKPFYENGEEHRLDLRNTDLRGLELPYEPEAKLQGVDFTKANLQRASLANANLQKALLNEANIQGAWLVDAKLQNSHLAWAELQGANLVEAKLQEADLWKADLRGANLVGAKTEGANFTGAKTRGASLPNCMLDNLNPSQIGASIKETSED